MGKSPTRGASSASDPPQRVIALTSSLGGIGVAAVVLGFTAIAPWTAVVALLDTNEPETLSAAWGGTYLTVAVVAAGAELAVSWAWGLQSAAWLHCALLLATAPAFLLMPSLPRSAETPSRRGCTP